MPPLLFIILTPAATHHCCHSLIRHRLRLPLQDASNDLPPPPPPRSPPTHPFTVPCAPSRQSPPPRSPPALFPTHLSPPTTCYQSTHSLTYSPTTITHSPTIRLTHRRRRHQRDLRSLMPPPAAARTPPGHQPLMDSPTTLRHAASVLHQTPPPTHPPDLLTHSLTHSSTSTPCST